METLVKFLIVLLAAVVILVDAKPTSRPSHHRRHHIHQKHCSGVRDQPCVKDIECACVSRHNSTLICNFERKCKKPSRTDVILRRIMNSQPCPKVFKRRCLVDTDCPCNERPLICEDHECVKDKRHQIF